jgi:hypothetical protein
VGRAAEAYTVVAEGDQSQAQLRCARIPEVTTAHSGFGDDRSCTRISKSTLIFAAGVSPRQVAPERQARFRARFGLRSGDAELPPRSLTRKGWSQPGHISFSLREDKQDPPGAALDPPDHTIVSCCRWYERHAKLPVSVRQGGEDSRDVLDPLFNTSVRSREYSRAKYSQVASTAGVESAIRGLISFLGFRVFEAYIATK